MANQLSARWTLPEMESTLEGKTGYGKTRFGEPRWARGSEWFIRPDDVAIPRHKSQKITSLKRLEEFKAQPERPLMMDCYPAEETTRSETQLASLAAEAARKRAQISDNFNRLYAVLGKVEPGTIEVVKEYV